MMLRKLNHFFQMKGKLLSEREYAQDIAAPYRMTLIKKYLGGYSRMVYYLGFYYPEWKPAKKEAAPVVEEPKADALEALRSSAEKTNDDD
jgi:hypothetical protein